MEQKYEGTPRAELRLDGRRVIRTEVTHDWGLLLQWVVRRDNQVVATVPARSSMFYEHGETTPGVYDVVLQMWRYVDYRKNPQGEFVTSRFVDVSNRVSYTI